MNPRLLNFAAGVSLLLGVAIIFLWVRDSARDEVIGYGWYTPTQECEWLAESSEGSFDFTITRRPHKGPRIAQDYEYKDMTKRDLRYPPKPYWFPYPPMQFAVSTPAQPVDIREFIIANWLFLLPTLPLPLIAIVRHRRRRRRETNNLCPTCGYDLRATPNCCPECGTLVLVGETASADCDPRRSSSNRRP